MSAEPIIIAKVTLHRGDLTFTAEGTEEWLSKQLEKVLASIGTAPKPLSKPAK